MNNITSRFVPLFGIVAVAITVFGISDSFAENNANEIERQIAIKEQLKILGINTESC